MKVHLTVLFGKVSGLKLFLNVPTLPRIVNPVGFINFLQCKSCCKSCLKVCLLFHNEEQKLTLSFSLKSYMIDASKVFPVFNSRLQGGSKVQSLLMSFKLKKLLFGSVIRSSLNFKTYLKFLRYFSVTRLEVIRLKALRHVDLRFLLLLSGNVEVNPGPGGHGNGWQDGDRERGQRFDANDDVTRASQKCTVLRTM